MAGTNNSWNNQITGSYNQIILNSGSNGVAIGTDNATGAITIGTGTSGRTINIGLSAANNLLFLGTSNGTAATNIQSGSGGLILNSVAGTATLDATSGVSINSTAGVLNLGDGANSFAVNIGTAGTRTVTMGSTTSTSTTTIACGTGGANFGTSANAHATVIGSTTASATTTIQAPTAGVILTGVQGVAVANKNYVTINTATGAIGSDAGPSSSISITGDTGGALTGSSFTFTGGTTGLSFGGSGSTETLTFAGITANGGTVSLATDATGSTVNIGTGAGAKVVTLGSTNTSSSLALKYGTADFTLDSATGTVMSALDTGEITHPLQPAFLAFLPSADLNVTGDGTEWRLGSTTALTEVFDQNGDFNTNGTFTAPVTGKYLLTGKYLVQGCTVATTFRLRISTSNRNYTFLQARTAGSSDMGQCLVMLCDMDASDTATLLITVTGEAGKTDDIFGDGSDVYSSFSGYLAC